MVDRSFIASTSGNGDLFLNNDNKNKDYICLTNVSYRGRRRQLPSLRKCVMFDSPWLPLNLNLSNDEKDIVVFRYRGPQFLIMNFHAAKQVYLHNICSAERSCDIVPSIYGLFQYFVDGDALS